MTNEKQTTLGLDKFGVTEPSGERPVKREGVIKDITATPFTNEQYGLTTRWLLTVESDGVEFKIGVFSKVFDDKGEVADISTTAGRVSMKSKMGRLMVMTGAKSIAGLKGKKVPLILDPKNTGFYTLAV